MRSLAVTWGRMECGGCGVICTGIGLSCPWRESYTRGQAAGSSISHGRLSARLADFFTSALSSWWDQSTLTTRPAKWLYCLLFLLLPRILKNATLTAQRERRAVRWLHLRSPQLRPQWRVRRGSCAELTASLNIKVHITLLISVLHVTGNWFFLTILADENGFSKWLLVGLESKYWWVLAAVGAACSLMLIMMCSVALLFWVLPWAGYVMYVLCNPCGPDPSYFDRTLQPLFWDWSTLVWIPLHHCFFQTASSQVSSSSSRPSHVTSLVHQSSDKTHPEQITGVAVI